MNIRSETGLTFDDVLLVPKRSSIRSRKQVDTTSLLVNDIRLSIPIISSNMDTVTEAPMAITMARLGALGIVHRFMSPQRQAEQVTAVKRAESFVVENPITISPESSLAEARQIMIESDIGGLVVVDEAEHLLGLLTMRDILLAPQQEALVRTVMTPRQNLVVAPAGEELDQARLALHAHRIEKLPLVDNEDRVVGLITAQDIIKLQEHPQATKDPKGRLRVGVAIGVRSADMERAELCVQAGADLLVVDIAHGHADHVIEMIRKLKSHFPQIPVIAGNVATADGVHDLAGAGADAVKVGVGAGSICTTRVVTGFGVPQLTAIAECVQAGDELGIPIIADGGMRTSGDLTKALAAGASSVMLGSALAGTDESPGASIIRNGRRYKVIRGMASLSANVERRQIDKLAEIDLDEWEQIVAEGVEALVPYRGSVEDIIFQLVGGLRSGMSYAGAMTLDELQEKAEFIRITRAGQTESYPHDVNEI